MEIPLALRPTGSDRLVYAIPIWYRVLMAAITVFIILSMVLTEDAPNLSGWIVLALVVAGGLFEESWVADRDKGELLHRAGFLVAARSTRLPLAEIERFRLVPFARGTVPGSEEEKIDNEETLKGNRADDKGRKRFWHRKPLVCLVVSCVDGTEYLLNLMQARRADELRSIGRRLASHCDRPFVEG
jgi:hypothetical protein